MTVETQGELFLRNQGSPDSPSLPVFHQIPVSGGFTRFHAVSRTEFNSGKMTTRDVLGRTGSRRQNLSFEILIKC